MSVDPTELIAVEILVSDPWGFGTKHGVGPFPCAMPASNEDSAWARALLSKAIVIDDKSCNVAWIKARHVGKSLSEVFRGREVAANFVFSSDVEGNSPAESGFPGPFAAIGSVRLKGTPEPM